MTIAHIIENEALAKRAPVPVGWKWDMGTYFLSVGSNLTVDQVMARRDADAIHFRMSDGSLCIVRPKLVIS